MKGVNGAVPRGRAASMRRAAVSGMRGVAAFEGAGAAPQASPPESFSTCTTGAVPQSPVSSAAWHAVGVPALHGQGRGRGCWLGLQAGAGNGPGDLAGEQEREHSGLGGAPSARPPAGAAVCRAASPPKVPRMVVLPEPSVSMATSTTDCGRRGAGQVGFVRGDKRAAPSAGASSHSGQAAKQANRPSRRPSSSSRPALRPNPPPLAHPPAPGRT
jgi:hypothetical protein